MCVITVLAESYNADFYMESTNSKVLKPRALYGALQVSQGPLHRWAKSRDHEIVRAQKVSKGRPNTPPISFSVVTEPQV